MPQSYSFNSPAYQNPYQPYQPPQRQQPSLAELLSQGPGPGAQFIPGYPSALGGAASTSGGGAAAGIEGAGLIPSVQGGGAAPAAGGGGLGALGPAAGFAALALLGKGIERENQGNPIGDTALALTGPSISQMLADPKLLATGLFAPLLSPFVASDKAKHTDAEGLGFLGL